MCGHVSLLCLCLLFVSSNIQGGQENLTSTWTTIVRQDAQAWRDEGKEGAEKTIRMYTEQLSSCNSRLDETTQKLITISTENLMLKQQLEDATNNLGMKIEAGFLNMTQELDSKYNRLQSTQREILQVIEAKKLSANFAILNGLIQLGDKFYYFSKSEKRSWLDAQLFCRYRDLHLVSVESAVDNQLIFDRKQLLGMSDTWLGATNKAVDGTWRWIGTNQTLTYTNWKIGEPNGDARGSCMEMGSNGEWDDYRCSYEQPFICQLFS